MLNFLIYMLEVSVLTSLFYLFYRYLYFKLAYFEWSRYFFYAALILSLTIPVLPSIFNTSNTFGNAIRILGFSDTESRLFVNISDSYLSRETSFLSQLPILNLLFIIWLSGFIRYMYLILKSIVSSVLLINSGKKIQTKNYKIIFSEKKQAAFSFFSNIVVGYDFNLLSEEEKTQIINHEKIHIKQFHTIDNIIFEIFRALFWFNPVSRLISANIKIIHEFIVDNQLTGNKNNSDYSRLILKLATHRSFEITKSHFSTEEIKNRIKLITFPENQSLRKRRFYSSLPVLLISLTAAWIILSSVNSIWKLKPEPEKEFHKPFKKENYKIISPFFQNYINQTKGEQQLIISHNEASYEVKSFSEVYAICSGTISSIKENTIYELNEKEIILTNDSGYLVEYRGLYQTCVIPNRQVKKGEKIGLSGDIRLYPSVSIKIIKKGNLTDPETLY